MNLMRGPKEEVVEQVVEEEKTTMKPLGAPPIPEDTGPPALPSAPAGKGEENGKESPPMSGEESGETTAEEGGEVVKEEQITLQDLLGYVRLRLVLIV